LQFDKPLKDYWFVAQAELSIEGVNDKEEHQMTDESFDILLFTPEEKMNWLVLRFNMDQQIHFSYRLMSALMHM
jgi:myosin heavy chain 6/7